MSGETDTDGDRISVAQRIANVPCAKDALIYGISGTIFGYLATFAFTSSGKKAFRYANFIFAGITVPYFLICRRSVDRSRQAMKEIMELPGVKKPLGKVD